MLDNYFLSKLQMALPQGYRHLRFAFKIHTSHYGGVEKIRLSIPTIWKGVHPESRALSLPEPKAGFNEEKVFSDLLSYAKTAAGIAEEHAAHTSEEEVTYHRSLALGLKKATMKYTPQGGQPYYTLAFQTQDKALLERAARHLEDFLQKEKP